MRLRGVDLVLDVGANRGQYATGLRMSGYQGRIVSFEPIPAAYEDLFCAHGPDDQWAGRQATVGAAAGSAELNSVRQFGAVVHPQCADRVVEPYP